MLDSLEINHITKKRRNKLGVKILYAQLLNKIIKTN